MAKTRKTTRMGGRKGFSTEQFFGNAGCIHNIRKLTPPARAEASRMSWKDRFVKWFRGEK